MYKNKITATIKDLFLFPVIVLLNLRAYSLFIIAILSTVSIVNAQNDSELIPYKSGDKWGFVDSNFFLVIPCEYKHVDFFSDGYALVDESDISDMHFIDKKNKTCFSKYYCYESFISGLAIVEDKTKNKLGAIDTTGKIIIPFEYSSLFWYGSEYIKGNDENEYYIFDLKGNIIAQSEYRITFFNGKYMIINNFDEGSDYSNDKVMDLGTSALLNAYGDVLIDFSNKLYFDVKGNYITYQEYSQRPNVLGFGLMDIKGNVIINPKVLSLGNMLYSEGYCIIRKDIGKGNRIYGYADTTGKVKIPPTYDDAFIFENGLTFVGKGGKYGMIDKNNKVVIPFQYDSVGWAENGVSVVKSGNKYGYINTKGEIIQDCIYDEAWDFNNNHAFVRQKDKFGIIDSKGNLLVPCKYDYGTKEFSETEAVNHQNDLCFRGSITNDNFILISYTDRKKNEILGYIDLKGNEYFDDGKKLKTKKYKNICYAIHSGDEESIKQFVSEGVDLNIKYPFYHHEADGAYPLDILISEQTTTASASIKPILELFIKNGCNLNVPIGDNEGNCLHLVIEKTYTYDMPYNIPKQRYDIIKLLVENGADVNAIDKNNKTPLHILSSPMYYWASIKEEIYLDYTADKIAQLLIEKGANVNALDIENKSPLDLAKENKKAKTLISVLKNAR